MAIDHPQLEKVIKDLLQVIADQPDRSGLDETPARVARAWAKLTEGYSRDFRSEAKTFENKHQYDDIILSGKIDFVSMCEHHLLPFWGEAYVAYIPSDRLIGLSKLARLIDIYSRRLQDQESITQQAANELFKYLEARGVAVMIRSRHFCMIARGVEKSQANMVTASFLGEFKDERMQQRFEKMVHFSNA